MIATIAAVVALVGAAVASPVSRAKAAGITESGAGFKAKGATVAGAAADADSGTAAAGIDGIGTVIGAAAPGLATGIALSSPTL